MTTLAMMMRQPFNLSRNFNLFGPRFEEWLARMLPTTIIGGSTGKLARDFNATLLNDLHRKALDRLIALWVQMNAPKPATQ